MLVIALVALACFGPEPKDYEAEGRQLIARVAVTSAGVAHILSPPMFEGLLPLCVIMTIVWSAHFLIDFKEKSDDF